ncbi:MAG: cob(I)yrinic acid a,c-diamide adenosyltransferase [Rhodocyclaceae bacterium]
MANRLSRITTRTGDDGSTGLGDGTRTRKSSARIHALGDVDELNSSIGVLLCESLPDAARATLVRMQNELFDLGGEIAVPGYTMVSEAHVERLEADVTTFNAALPPLKEFILPGGSRSASLAHMARTVARRAERAVVELSEKEEIGAPVRQYLNRASDLLFVLGRWLNREAGVADVLWERR